MSKKHLHRFGMAYFGTRPLWARKDPDATGVLRPVILVIRDTHCEWKVSDLWQMYMAPKQAPVAVEATPEVTAAVEALHEQA